MRKIFYVLVSLAALIIISYVARSIYTEHQATSQLVHENGIATYLDAVGEIDKLNAKYSLEINTDSMKQSVSSMDNSDSIARRIGDLILMKDSIQQSHK